MNNDLIEINNIKNFWIVYLMPFAPEERGEAFVKEYQEYCKENNIFGMGWNNDESLKKFKDAENNIQYVENTSETKKTAEMKAFYLYKQIAKDDLVMMRLKNGKYYIGKVKEEAKPCEGKDILPNNDNYLNTGRFSYICEVEKWYEFFEYELPGDIVGRFSQRRHPTIQHISEDNKIFQNLMYILYRRRFSEEHKIEIEDNLRIELELNNFASAINYMDLEDLVYLYILNKNKEQNYKLFPSECKSSKIYYEFDLVDMDNPNKRITCQVKNRASVFFEDYINDANSSEYEKIYLFSGIGNYGYYKFEINEEDAMKQIKLKNPNGKLEIIAKSDLYTFFINNEFMWEKDNLNMFYKKSN